MIANESVSGRRAKCLNCSCEFRFPTIPPKSTLSSAASGQHATLPHFEPVRPHQSDEFYELSVRPDILCKPRSVVARQRVMAKEKRPITAESAFIVAATAGFVLLLVLVTLLTQRNRNEVDDTFVMTGEIGQLVLENEAILVARSNLTLDRVVQLSAAHDTEGVLELMLSGQAFLVPRGTKVRVIGRGQFMQRFTEVRILEGDRYGQSGWVVTDAVKHF